MQRDARCPDPVEPTGDDDGLVLETQLPPEVDSDAREDEVPRVAGIA
jgi:hypothetical protein